MAKVALYCRVDHGSMAYGHFAIEQQKKQLEQFARINGLCVAGFYFDSGCPAKDLERPGLQKLLKDYKKGKFQAVIVTKPDRLYRGNIPPAPKWPFEIISLNAQQARSN